MSEKRVLIPVSERQANSIAALLQQINAINANLKVKLETVLETHSKPLEGYRFVELEGRKAGASTSFVAIFEKVEK